jgi:mgtE-like transporter
LVDVIFISIILYISVKHRREREFMRTLNEFFPALVVVAFIVTVTGSFLGKISQVTGVTRELYIVYPALIDTIGDVGSTVGSLATTKLALGTIDSSFTSIRKNVQEISGACSSSAIWFFFFSVVSSYLAHGALVLNELFRLTVLLLTLNLLAAPIISVFSYSTAVLTYKKGLNPDNFVIPFESSLADSVTTICLFIVMSMFIFFL